MVVQGDAAWGDQTGGPRDPQPGNGHASRDVLRSAGNLPIGTPPPASPSGAAGTLTAAPALAAPSQTFSAPALTNSTTVPVKLAFDGAAQMAFSVNGAPWSALQPYATSATVTLPSPDGVDSVAVEVVDAFGNTLTASTAVQLDRTPPAQPTLALNALDDHGMSSTDFVTNVAAPRVVVSGEAGATPTVYVDGVLYTGQTLADGTHTLTATLTDAAGNVSTAAAHTLVIDTAPPSAKLVVQTNGVTVSGTLAVTSNVVNLKLVAVKDTGSGVAQAAVSLDGGTTWSALAASSGAIAVTLPGDGTYAIVVRVIDLAGNSDFMPTQSVRLDTTGPTLAASGVSGSYDLGASAALTYSASDIDGVSSIGASLDGSTTVTSGAALNLYALTAGTHTIVVTGTDALGNVSTTTVTFQLHPSVGGLLNAVAYGASQRWINSSVQNQLNSTLQSANLALAFGQSARSYVSTFISQVTGAGSKITSSYAALLVNWAQDLLARLS
jgi:hypothetical protein